MDYARKDKEMEKKDKDDNFTPIDPEVIKAAEHEFYKS